MNVQHLFFLISQRQKHTLVRRLQMCFQRSVFVADKIDDLLLIINPQLINTTHILT